ncbi:MULTISPECIES: hypothetical protein [unclassified Spirosoma]|uniref:hypothetical protein n=1 Tax=unclassified Spirosoma TaxID=2621999 RepID=UPI000960EFBA|nr:MULTISPECIES: hypothetical protein [unclassified Spirosoma]MBN8821882.1 hypothetical protein [Spirosoma sp.]OJW80634.1 MAG: hypothetical protein BGO59_34780 [Spirosoma sp. 48-14]
MKAYQNDYLSEFEQEFELDNESPDSYNEFELVDNEFDNEGSWETDNEFDSEGNYDVQNEADYLSEFETDDEFENDDEFDSTPDGRYEARLYEIFSNNYENEFEFENDFNEVMHEIEKDYFWGALKKWGKKLAPLAKGILKAIPGGGTLTTAIQQITKDPRGLLKSLAMKFGPQALNAVVPGAGAILGTVLSNQEMTSPSAARQAARDTVALAKQAYTNFADGISRSNFSRNFPQAKAQMNQLARSAFKKAHHTVRLGSANSRYRRVGRKVRDEQNGLYKIVTITYKRL